jgi:hypothetical protein
VAAHFQLINAFINSLKTMARLYHKLRFNRPELIVQEYGIQELFFLVVNIQGKAQSM